MKADRGALIRQYLYATGPASVQAIAGAVGASLATVRRDLQVLETGGVILRDHGGARIAERAGVEVAFERREQLNLSAKRAIAAAAYALIMPDTTIFLDAGTTVHQLARRLRLNPIPLQVVSNCIPIAQELGAVAGVTVTLLGGRFRPENASMVGMLTERALEELWFDTLFLGVGAIADDGCIASLDADEAQANRRMLARTRRKVLMVDASKFGQHLTYRVAALATDMTIITDSTLTPAWRRRLQDLGCGLQLVDTALHPGVAV